MINNYDTCMSHYVSYESLVSKFPDLWYVEVSSIKEGGYYGNNLGVCLMWLSRFQTYAFFFSL